MEHEQEEVNTARWRNYLAGHLIAFLLFGVFMLLPSTSLGPDVLTTFLFASAAGALLGLCMVVGCEYEVANSFIKTNTPRYLNITMTFLFVVFLILSWGLSWYCESLPAQGPAPGPYISCMRIVISGNIAAFSALFGVFVIQLGWALMLERKHGSPLMVEIRSKKPKAIGVWPIRDLVLFGGFAIFLVYLFYRIFTLR